VLLRLVAVNRSSCRCINTGYPCTRVQQPGPQQQVFRKMIVHTLHMLPSTRAANCLKPCQVDTCSWCAV
jgi:hypothetical protein